MPKAFYLTTPLYYVNAKPHLGHAYTTIVADCIARWHRQHGDAVFLLTGTDEHGEKVARAAKEVGLSPKEFADRTSQTFRALWKTLGISYDHFIRTTDADHERIVQRVLSTLLEKGAIQPGTYTFWYCVPCETGWTEGDFPDAKAKFCPSCKRAVEQVTEEDFFLQLEPHRAWLRKEISSRSDFILPATRRNEVLALLEKELPPLCITRPRERVSWGIEVPFSQRHVTYVWFDALLNYVSALGWPDGERFRTYWQQAGAVHLVGKDILRHHGLYWPIILHALGVEPPRTVFAHGWWLIKGEKMSKSVGKIVDPEAVAGAYGLDAFRYFLLRDVPLGDDGVFSEESLVRRINADLANDLGNLVYRTLTMLEKHAGGKIPSRPADSRAVSRILQVEQAIAAAMGAMAPGEALKALWELVTRANESVEQKAPWTLAREGRREELEGFLHDLACLVRAIALGLWPFMPGTAESIWSQMGFPGSIAEIRLPEGLRQAIPGGQGIQKGTPLFPRLS